MFEQISARTDILHQALDGLAARERTTSHNLANADTPGYRAQEVHFEDRIKAKLRAMSGETLQMAKTDERHLLPEDGDQRAFTVHELLGRMRNDGNGVDLEQEISRMAQAQMSYNAVSQQLAGSFSSLKYVISEGGRA